MSAEPRVCEGCGGTGKMAINPNHMPRGFMAFVGGGLRDEDGVSRIVCPLCQREPAPPSPAVPPGEETEAALHWALDMLDMYDAKLAATDGPDAVYTPIHLAGKAKARAALAALRAAHPVDVVAGIRTRNGRYWLCRRNADGAHAGLAGMWEYPGGKVERGEQLRDALRRELLEEFGVEATVGRVLDSINDCTTAATGSKVYRVTFFEIDMPDQVELRNHTDARWMTPEEACSAEQLPSGTMFNARHLAPLIPATDR